MEDILKLQECHKRKTTFKQAFYRAIRYDWLPGTTYQSLHVKEIEASINRADLINDAKMNGQELTQEMILRYEEENELIDELLGI